MILNKENLPGYLQSHYPQFCTGPLTVSAIGDSEDDNPGLINFIFRVKSPAGSIIVKQGRTDIATNVDVHLPVNRNRMECESLRLRAAIVPDMIPQVYYQDLQENVFIMEDVAYLRPSRFLLTESKLLPLFGRQCAHYAAATSFYTSEFYLDTDQFRALTAHFTNSQMRQVMENWVFLRKNPYPLSAFGDQALRRSVDNDAELALQSHLLRHKFMCSTEALIHGDLHTSNIFADEKSIKVLDMEYTFAGPFGYDIGYLMGSLLTQYCSACYRPFPTPHDRGVYKTFLLNTIYDLYTGFVQEFSDAWDADAKLLYRSAPSFKEKLLYDLLPDVLGFAAIPTLSPSQANISLVDEYKVIQDVPQRRKAMALCVFLARYTLRKRQNYHDMNDFLADLLKLEDVFNHTC